MWYPINTHRCLPIKHGLLALDSPRLMTPYSADFAPEETIFGVPGGSEQLALVDHYSRWSSRTLPPPAENLNTHTSSRMSATVQATTTGAWSHPASSQLFKTSSNLALSSRIPNENDSRERQTVVRKLLHIWWLYMALTCAVTYVTHPPHPWDHVSSSYRVFRIANQRKKHSQIDHHTRAIAVKDSSNTCIRLLYIDMPFSSARLRFL